MSIGNSIGMGTPFFNQIKKQASFFLREKIKHARLALTDVTPAQLLTEEATGGNPWAPDAKTMGFISRAAFEIDDFWRIVEILHKRLAKFDKKNWREFYNALVLLDHLLTHGPESVADEFQFDAEVLHSLESFQLVDERGFDWGLAMRNKSERVLSMLEKGQLLKQERDRARKVTRGIQGFGSMNYRGTQEHSSDYFGRCNSHYESYDHQQADDDLLEGMNQSSTAGTVDIQKKIVAVEQSILGEDEAFLGDDEAKNKDLEQFLVRKEVERPKIQLQREDHPFVFNEHQRMESMVLLSQS